MTQPSQRRRSLVSNPHLQKRMLLAITWPVVLLIAGNSAILSILIQHTGERELDWLYVPLLIGFCLLVLAGGFFLVNTIRVSNQILGPLIRIHETLQMCKQGKIRHIELRDRDYLSELAGEINELLDWAEQQAKQDTENAAPEPATADL